MPVIPDDAFNDQLVEMVRWWKLNRFKPPQATPQTNTPRGPIRGILLEDLPDNGTADVAITVYEPNTFIQNVKIIGDVMGGTFKLHFQGTSQPTVDIPFNATPDQMRAALEALPTVGKGNVAVQIGQQTTYQDRQGNDFTASPAYWIIEFVGSFTMPRAQAPPALSQYSSGLQFSSFGGVVLSDSGTWVDSGITEKVRAVIPVGSPTPMRQGAVVWCEWHTQAGYCVVGLEPRVLSPIYY
jgi:hypothetical protein